MDFDLKIVAAVVSPALGILGFLPYFWGMFKKETKPHIYTWLIWTITLAIANASIFHGGGGTILSIGIAASVVLSFGIVLLCFRYGTKNITLSDTVTLIAALAAVGIWVGLKNPVLALLLATGIDLIGYWPTYRKSFLEPWSENLSTWILYTLAPALTLFSLQQYNVLTITYSAATLAANFALIILLVSRRAHTPRPTQQ